MNAYDLPTALEVGGKEYQIRYNWRAVLDALAACSDPDLNDKWKAICLLQIIYADWETIPYEHLQEACKKASDFIDCGQKDDGKAKPRMIDWQQDASLIIPEINKVAGREVRMDPNIHWWTFFGWFMGIGEGLFASVLQVRKKKITHKKLEKWEQDFYRENKKLVDLKNPESEEVHEEKNNIMKFL